MAKTSGLGANFYIGGYDLSGDVSALDKIASIAELLDVTAINESAYERIFGRRDGAIDFSSWFNYAALHEHPALSTLPTGDVLVTAVPVAVALGAPAACMLAKQINYDPTRAANGSLSVKVQTKANAESLEWGELLTVGKETFGGIHTGGFDQRLSQLPATIAIASVAIANPGQVNTSTPHGLVTGDSVLITGTTTTPNINLRYSVTVTSGTQFTIPVNVTAGQAGPAGTVQQTSTDFGCSAYLQVMSFTGTDATVKLQHVEDSNNSPIDVTGGGFTQITSAPFTQRITVAASVPIKEWMRYTITTSGGFSSIALAVIFCRNYAASVL